MKDKKIVITLFWSAVFFAFCSCGIKNSQEIQIAVTTDKNGQMVLSIENSTKDIVLFDDPRFSRSARFNWELFNGQEIVASSEKVQIERDPLLGGHISTGPIDISPGREFKCNLSKYYPDLANRDLVGNAKIFLWNCRVWNQTTTNWIQTCGIVHLD